VGYIQTCTSLESSTMWHPKGDHHSVLSPYNNIMCNCIHVHIRKLIRLIYDVNISWHKHAHYPLLVVNVYDCIHPHWIEMKLISCTIYLVLGKTLSCINSTIHIHLLLICLVFLWVVINLQNAKELLESFIFYCKATMFKRWNTKTN
jgi:hypothetical protein